MLVGFAPSFSFILIGSERFDRLRANETVRAFLDGADPAAIGVIAGAAVPFALALTETWQVAVLAAERSGSWRPLGPDDLLDLGPPPVMQHSEPDPDTQRQQPLLRRTGELTERLSNTIGQLLVALVARRDRRGRYGPMAVGPVLVVTWFAPVTVPSGPDEARGPPSSSSTSYGTTASRRPRW